MPPKIVRHKVAKVAKVRPDPPPLRPLNYSYKAAVIAMAATVAVLLIFAAYFTDRNGAVDEIGLFNPPYMAFHFGKMTYPVHGYFNAMVVHPPVHYEMIALAMRLGFNSYYAEATPTLLMLLLGVLLIARGPFPGPVKIGLLYGVGFSVALFGGVGLELFGTRPEGDVAASWLTGLVALESGRLEKWNLRKLFAGALILTYAGSLHYYAAAGILGAGVYMVWAYRELGFSRSLKPLAAIAGGGLLFGAPYLLFFVIPNREAILGMVRGTQTGSSMAGILREHLSQYRYWAAEHIGSFLLRIPFLIGAPVVILSTPILLAIRSTRGIALAALPLQLFLLLFAWHKLPPYYIHEVELFSAAVVAGTLMLADRFLPRLPGRWARYLVWSALVLLMGAGWWQSGKWRRLYQRSDLLTLSMEPRVHEMEIARAAGMEMLGANARVATRIGSWYASGAAHYHDPSSDIVWPASLPPGFASYYFSQFDAVAENAHMSNAGGGSHRTLLSWYLDGTLKLRGFFFSAHNDGLNYWLFSGRQPVPVTAFALGRDGLTKFEEDPAGADELVAFTSPQNAALEAFGAQFPFHSVMYLPKLKPQDDQEAIVAALAPASYLRLYDSMPRGSRIVQRVRGRLESADARALLDKMKREDGPIHFYANYRDVPGVMPFKAATASE
ncbi:MAG TPA: hypothetical protein VGJ09_13490 [Bryobacteraceae bacterium]